MLSFDVNSEPIYDTNDEFDVFKENLDGHCQEVGFKVDMLDFDVNIGPIIIVDDNIAMNVNEETDGLLRVCY